MSNDRPRLVPRTDIGGRTLEFDYPGLEIGVAEYLEGPTGCTVVHLARRSAVHIDVRGGSADLSGEQLRALDAICLAGGSHYGLEAARGVALELFDRRGRSTKWQDIALVSGAVIFDFGRRQNAIYPDRELGRAAMSAARAGVVPLGPHGAGCSATAGHGDTAELSGQGAAFRRLGSTRVAVFTVVNAYGAIVDRSGAVVRGNRDVASGVRRHAADVREATGAYYPNTTLTVVVTTQKLDELQLRSFARQVHASMARAIQPFHARWDGDVLYAVSTGEVESAELDEVSLGVVASELAWDAVLASFDPFDPGT